MRQPWLQWCGKIWELMDAVDSYLPDPERELDKPFLMPVEDVFTITVVELWPRAVLSVVP